MKKCFIALNNQNDLKTIPNIIFSDENENFDTENFDESKEAGDYLESNSDICNYRIAVTLWIIYDWNMTLFI